MCIGHHAMEGPLNPGAIRVCDVERRQKLDRVACVRRHLHQDLVILEQRDDDKLAEQPARTDSSNVHAALSLKERGWPNSIPIISPLPRTFLTSS